MREPLREHREALEVGDLVGQVGVVAADRVPVQLPAVGHLGGEVEQAIIGHRAILCQLRKGARHPHAGRVGRRELELGSDLGEGHPELHPQHHCIAQGRAELGQRPFIGRHHRRVPQWPRNLGDLAGAVPQRRVAGPGRPSFLRNSSRNCVEQHLPHVREQRAGLAGLEVVEAVEGPHHCGLNEVVGVGRAAHCIRHPAARPPPEKRHTSLSNAARAASSPSWRRRMSVAVDTSGGAAESPIVMIHEAPSQYKQRGVDFIRRQSSIPRAVSGCPVVFRGKEAEYVHRFPQPASRPRRRAPARSRHR